MSLSVVGRSAALARQQRVSSSHIASGTSSCDGRGSLVPRAIATAAFRVVCDYLTIEQNNEQQSKRVYLSASHVVERLEARREFPDRNAVRPHVARKRVRAIERFGRRPFHWTVLRKRRIAFLLVARQSEIAHFQHSWLFDTIENIQRNEN